MLAEHAGHRGQHAGLVGDVELQVVGGVGLVDGSQAGGGERAESVAHAAAEILRHSDEVAQHGAGCGEAACAASVEHQVLHGLAFEEHCVEGVAHRGQRMGGGHHRRMHPHGDLAVLALGHGQQLDDMAHPGCGGNVAPADPADALLVDIAGHHLGAERGHGQDRCLGASVEPLHISGRIGLGVAQPLRLAEHVGVVGPVLGHAGEDVVRRAVHDAHHTGDALADERVAQHPDQRDAAGDRRLEGKVDAVGSSQGEQLLADIGDELLVGRHDRLACTQSGADQVAGRLDAAHRFHHHVHVVGHHQRLAVAGEHAVGQCHRPLGAEIAHRNPRHLEAEPGAARQVIRLTLQDRNERSAHIAAPQDAHPQRARLARVSGGRRHGLSS